MCDPLHALRDHRHAAVRDREPRGRAPYSTASRPAGRCGCASGPDYYSVTHRDPRTDQSRLDIYVVTTRGNRTVRSREDIDRPGVPVAVQAGTFMEPVMTASLKQATMVVVQPPQTREQKQGAGGVDEFMTDYPYRRRLLDVADSARLVTPSRPFLVVPYACAVRPGKAVAWRSRPFRGASQARRSAGIGGTPPWFGRDCGAEMTLAGGSRWRRRR